MNKITTFILSLIIIFLVASLSHAECVIKDDRPDPMCTPGAYMTNVTAKDICVSGYTAKVRNVPDAVKKQVFQAYGMSNKQAPCPCEVDHFVSLELGGSNDFRNLWPQPYANPDGARIKDQVENWLHAQVCKGNMTLDEAQLEIVHNWKDIYARIHAKD